MLTGPIVRLTLAGDEMMILSDPEDCEELVITKGFTFRNVLLTLTQSYHEGQQIILLGNP